MRTSRALREPRGETGEIELAVGTPGPTNCCDDGIEGLGKPGGRTSTGETRGGKYWVCSLRLRIGECPGKVGGATLTG
jgi:hypothetical protein